jgi:hypothetical protein
MNAILRIVAVVIVALAGSGELPEAGQQQPTFHKPMAPIGPTSDAQCQALQNEWGAVCQRISDAHQQCLDANADPRIKGAGKCDKAPCLALHVENESCGGAERTNAVNACWASVRAHHDREAQFKAAQEAVLRAQQEAERERKSRLAADAAKSRMEEDAARRRKADYVRNTPKPGANRPGLDRRQASLLADLRNEAERNASRYADPTPLPGPKPTPNGPPPAPPAYEAIENEIPELSAPIDFINGLADDLNLPVIKHATEVMGWFAKIHDGRRAEVEAARTRFNEAFRRERPNDVNFKNGDCTFFPDYCKRVVEGFSFETQQLYDAYQNKRTRYNGWTDLGNITGVGWSPKDKEDFLLSIGRTAGDAAKSKVEEWIKKQNREVKENEPIKKVQDAFQRNFNKGLDQYFPTPSPTPRATPAPDWNLNQEAIDKYMAEMKRLERERKQPQRSEPNPLQQLLKELPVIPISTLPPTTSVPPRR